MKDGLEFYRGGDYLQAINSFQSAVKRAKLQKLIPECLTGSLYQLGLSYQRADKLLEAECTWRELLALDKTSSSHPDVMRAYLNLASLYEKLNRLPAAESMYKRLLAIEEQSLGSDNPEIARSLNDLAAFYERNQRQKEALALYSRILQIKEVNIPNRKCDPYVATITYRLAKRYLENQELEKAKGLFQKAIDCRRLYPGRHSIDLADAVMGMGQCYAARGENYQAEKLLLESLAMRIDSLGPKDQQIATVSSIVGQFYLSIGQNTKALAFFTKSLQIAEQLLGPSDPGLASHLLSVAKAQEKLGSYGQAEQNFNRVIALSQSNTFPAKLRKAVAFRSLANVYVIQNRFPVALEYLTNSLEIFRTLNHPEVVSIQQQLKALSRYTSLKTDDLESSQAALPLAQTLIDSDENVAALAILNRAIAKTASNDQALLVRLLLRQATVYQKLGKLSQAETSAKQAQSIVLAKQGQNCLSMAGPCITLARLYSCQSKTKQAAANYETALRLYERHSHPDTSILAKEYASMLKRTTPGVNSAKPKEDRPSDRPSSL